MYAYQMDVAKINIFTKCPKIGNRYKCICKLQTSGKEKFNMVRTERK